MSGKSGALRQMLGKSELEHTGGRTGNYNKRAIPFSMDDEVHVNGLRAIVEQFADPWTLGRQYTRGDLATDIAEFFVAIADGRLVVAPAPEKSPSKKSSKK